MNGIKRIKILVVEDDNLNRDLICTLLRGYGEIQEATTFEEAKDLLSFNQFDLAFVDLDLHGKQSGFKIARQAKDKSIYTVILSGQKDQASIKKAFDYSECDNYLYKPANVSMVKEVMEHFANQSEVLKLDQLINSAFTTKSSKLSEVLSVVKTIYKGQTPIYVLGETGTGKQVLAELVHKLKFGSLENFYHLNCAAISDNIIESELFGYIKGAFTGADQRKIGLFEKAHGGTLFLDEIATMSPLNYCPVRFTQEKDKVNIKKV